MKAALLTHALALVLGALGCWWFLSSRTVTLEEFRAVAEQHTLAVAAGADLRAERDAHHRAAVDAMNTADSLRRLRPEIRTRVAANPDSSARAAGIAVTAPDPLTRCIPLADLALLLADRAELGLADSSARWDNVGLSACLEALSYSDSAEAVARANAVRLYEAGKALSGEVATLRRTRWLWAAGGAVGGILLVMGIGAAL